MIKIDLIGFTALIAASVLIVVYMSVVLHVDITQGENGLLKTAGFWICLAIYGEVALWRRGRERNRKENERYEL